MKRAELEGREAVDVARVARKRAGSLAYTVLVVVAVVMLVVISVNFRTSWDVSVTTDNSLSPMTLTILDGLEKDVYLYPFIPGKDDRERVTYWDLLRLYRNASDHIKVEFVDPIRSPGRLAELGVDASEQDLSAEVTTLVVSGEDRFTFLGTSEEDVTNAVHEVGKAENRVVGILRGYGERDPSSTSDAGLSGCIEALKQEYYEVRDVHASQGIHDDVTVLLLVGPRLALPSRDIEVISGWLREGDGRLMAMIDPENENGINQLLLPWGVHVARGQIMDQTENIGSSAAFLRISDYSDHAVVKGFGTRYPIALPIVAPVDHFETDEGAIYHQELASSSRYSKALADGVVTQGPFNVAVASWYNRIVEGVEAETRVILVGNSGFVSNAYLMRNANRNFFLNCIGWLSRETKLVTIRRPILAGQTIEITESDRKTILSVLLFTPTILLVTCLVVIWRRRGR